MSPIIFALLSPAVLAPAVTFITSLIKKTPIVNDNMEQNNRNLILRSIAAVLSLGGVIGAFILTGVAPDPTVISNLIITLVLAFTTFVGATGVHEIAKK